MVHYTNCRLFGSRLYQLQRDLNYHFPSYLLKKSPEGSHQGILIKSKTVGCNIRASYSKQKMFLHIKLKILADWSYTYPNIIGSYLAWCPSSFCLWSLVENCLYPSSTIRPNPIETNLPKWDFKGPIKNIQLRGIPTCANNKSPFCPLRLTFCHTGKSHLIEFICIFIEKLYVMICIVQKYPLTQANLTYKTFICYLMLNQLLRIWSRFATIDRRLCSPKRLKFRNYL